MATESAPQAIPHTLDVDDDGADSAYYEDLDDMTASLTSSIFNNKFEDGRRFHAYKAGKYVLPDDEPEQERLDLTYHGWRLMYGDIPFFAPLKHPHNILDVGTGTGIWAIDVGDAYPGAEVIGTDLSPIQPSWVPPNVKFEIDDAAEEWTFPLEKFDLIHTRILSGVAINDWQIFYKKAYKHITPGGYVESQDFDCRFGCDDGTLSPTSLSVDWITNFTKGAAAIGMNLHRTGVDLGEEMKAAGFVDIVVKEFKLPMGPWPADEQLRQAGLAVLVATLDGCFGMSLKIFKTGLGWSVEELEVYLAMLRKEWKTKGTHAYFPCYTVYGRKPHVGEEVSPNQTITVHHAPKLVPGPSPTARQSKKAEASAPAGATKATKEGKSSG